MIRNTAKTGEQVEEILVARGEKYGDSWLTPTLAIQAITQGDFTKLDILVASGHFADWFMILGKLCRAVYSPDHIDHWVDIAGYAQLSANFITAKSLENS
jgi:hypothetical protein